MLALGCDRDPLVDQPPTASELRANSPSSTLERLEGLGLEEDRFSVRLMRQVPEYGGALLDSRGVLTLYATDSSVANRLAIAARAELARVGRDNPPSIKVVLGQYSYGQLLRWRFALLPLLKVRGISWSEIDEESNGVRIGVEDVTSVGPAQNHAVALGIPLNAIRIVVSPKPRRLQQLTSRTRPFLAGTQSESFVTQPGYTDVRLRCTHGPSVVWTGHPGSYLVINSHCTQVTPPFGQYFGAGIYQNIAPTYASDSAYYRLGDEIADPNGFTGPPCPSGGICHQQTSNRGPRPSEILA